MHDNPLGQKTVYSPFYDKKLLFPILREINRKKNGIDPRIFTGYDMWNGYELSWLNQKGKPQARRIKIVYSSDSSCIVESKSLKLYFGSFIMTKFDNEASVAATIKKDLIEILGTDTVTVELFDERGAEPYTIREDALLLDTLDIACSQYHPDPGLLRFTDNSSIKEETFVSHLLKTNCPITGQPDWGTVVIGYKGRVSPDPASLLQYIVSYREHGDYHEACCEQIFADLYRGLSPESLFVKCFYTRRGGIDINPCRFTGKKIECSSVEHYWRQ